MNKPNKSLIIIVSGATATGKSDLSLKLSNHFNSQGHEFEIINFDSIQFYKELDIGSAKPSENEMKQLPHHLFNIKNVDEEMDASEFVSLAKPMIEDILSKNKIPVLVGGSAFYIRALVKGMAPSKPVSKETRCQVEEIVNSEGSDGLIKRLNEVDPASTRDLHPNDIYRLSRALEHWIETGLPFSESKKEIEDPYDFSKNKFDDSVQILHFYCFIEKFKHWEIIEKRSQKMIEMGLIDEVKGLLKLYSKDLKSLSSIGYKQVIEYLDDPQKANLEELIEKISIATRRLAKSQKTFFNKVEPKIIVHPIDDLRQVLGKIQKALDS
ncbi:MAG: tRNA (adenosine(37)-N6)-dimethylallyltransferase MiaA [Bacteriovoracaceae bacterium]